MDICINVDPSVARWIAIAVIVACAAVALTLAARSVRS